MANLPDKPTIHTIPWINGQTKLNSANLTSGVNNNLTNLKTAVDGIIDSFGDYLPLSGGTVTGPTTFNSSIGVADDAHFDSSVRIVDNLNVYGNSIFAHNVVITAAAPTAASHATRKDYVDSMSAKMTETTWAALKALRDGGNLVPGMQYRITDYQCATHQSGTSSAGHQFDIIVTADDANTLNENARACSHDGDTYFANNNLSAWKLMYCLDNDATRFFWADTTNGKGVVYRMIDEFNNECPYDFKNILFTKSGSYTNAYTFTYKGLSSPEDASLSGYENGCYANKIAERIVDYGVLRSLNFNVFYTYLSNFDCYKNELGIGCHDNSFLGEGCYGNVLGNFCHSNKFGGNYCHDNVFGHYCKSNTSGSSFYNNVLGDNCQSNTFASYCRYNIFEGSCSYNNLSDNCANNSFSINSRRNTLGEYCQNNRFGGNCSYITLGEESYYNDFGDNCSYITLGDSSSTIDYCKNIVIDNGCSYLYINSADTDAGSSNNLQNVHIHLGVTGSSSANRLTITVPDRNLAYEISYEMTGSTTVTL